MRGRAASSYQHALEFLGRSATVQTVSPKKPPELLVTAVQFHSFWLNFLFNNTKQVRVTASRFEVTIVEVDDKSVMPMSRVVVDFFRSDIWEYTFFAWRVSLQNAFHERERVRDTFLIVVVKRKAHSQNNRSLKALLAIGNQNGRIIAAR